MRWRLHNYSEEFRTPSVDSAGIYMGEDGKFFLAHSLPRTLIWSDRIKWERHRLTFSVGRSGKVSFRRRAMKVYPDKGVIGSKYDFFEGTEGKYREVPQGGNPDVPVIWGRHELSDEWERQVVRLRIIV